MSWEPARKWLARGAGGMTGVAGPGDDALLYTSRGQRFLSTRPNLAFGVRNFAGPLGAYGKVEFADKVILGGWSARTLDIITYGRYQAPSTAWSNSPKSRLQRWRSRRGVSNMEKGTAHSMGS